MTTGTALFTFESRPISEWMTACWAAACNPHAAAGPAARAPTHPPARAARICFQRPAFEAEEAIVTDADLSHDQLPDAVRPSARACVEAERPVSSISWLRRVRLSCDPTALPGLDLLRGRAQESTA